ncbi:MAG: substrate-binding domain-containing protein, partial [Chloroflexota bacterium]
MKHARCALAIMVCAVLVGCNPIDVPASPPPTTTPIIVYHTADTQSLMNAIADSEFALNFRAELHPEQQSYEMLLSQVSDATIPFFITHHNPTDAPETLSTLPLVQDGLAIIKHPDNPVTTLSRDDLQQIYRGFITDWHELGGNEATIALYTRPESSALRLEFDRLVMGQQRITPNAQKICALDR